LGADETQHLGPLAKQSLSGKMPQWSASGTVVSMDRNTAGCSSEEPVVLQTAPDLNSFSLFFFAFFPLEAQG